jgi:ribonuclease HI
MKNEVVEIYTDGACSGNPGPGGYGIVMMYKGHRKEMAQGYRRTTNNRMELLAVIIALETLKFDACNVIVHSDSQYVVNAIEKGWLKGWIAKNFAKIKNPDLWIRFYKIYQRHNVKLKWVRGHADNVENNRCDELAVAAAKSPGLLVDAGFEQMQSTGMMEE